MEPIDWTGSALQGGGSHGAFTWGMLDNLLEDSRLDIGAITGTSAGAMNAVVLAEGYLEGGRAGARKNLARFWRSIRDAEVYPRKHSNRVGAGCNPTKIACEETELNE
jgi:NTE family protein